MNGRAAADLAGAAFASILAPLFARLDELERRVQAVEAPDWMTLAEAADHVRATEGALRARARRGQLPGAVKDGGRWIVDRRALDDDLVSRGILSRIHENGRAPHPRPRPGTRR